MIRSGTSILQPPCQPGEDCGEVYTTCPTIRSLMFPVNLVTHISQVLASGPCTILLGPNKLISYLVRSQWTPATKYFPEKGHFFLEVTCLAQSASSNEAPLAMDFVLSIPYRQYASIVGRPMLPALSLTRRHSFHQGHQRGTNQPQEKCRCPAAGHSTSYFKKIINGCMDASPVDPPPLSNIFKSASS